MARFVLLFAIFTSVVGLSPATAGKADDAWAQCIWTKVPTSAANWLELPEPKRNYGLQDTPPEYALQFRLQAACANDLIPDGKRSAPSFNGRAVRTALASTKPVTIVADTTEPKAFRCTRYFLNDAEMKTPAAFNWGYGNDLNAAQFLSMQFFFAGEKGGAVGLPKEGGLKKCQYIREDGTFRDA